MSLNDSVSLASPHHHIQTYQSRITPIYSSLQNLAASSKGTPYEGGGSNRFNSMINDDVDSFGADLSISMSSEMQDFLHGLDESEAVLIAAGQKATVRMLGYLSTSIG